MEKCSLCKHTAEIESLGPLKRMFNIKCEICGQYRITSSASADLGLGGNFVNECAKISAFIKHREINNSPPITIFQKKENSEEKKISMSIEEIINEFPKAISDRIDYVLINIKKLKNSFGGIIEIDFEEYPIFYCDKQNTDSMLFMLKQLYLKDYIEPVNRDEVSNPILPAKIRLTAEGWDKVIELEEGKNILSKQVFIAMSFDDSLNEIYENGIKKAIEKLNYTPMRVDRKEYNEDICDYIITEIKKSKFAICDCTQQKQGVYFEAGFMMGLSRPVIWTCNKNDLKNIHFNTEHYNYITWEDSNELYEKLLNRIQATII